MLRNYTILLSLVCYSSIIVSQKEKSVMLVIGTRPECIKMAPLYHELKKAGTKTILCSTDQHTSLLEPFFSLFAMEPDIHLHVMRTQQTLTHVTTEVLMQLEQIFFDRKPSLVIVQGDTTSAMAAALAAFYMKIPVGHVEAGLRTYNNYAPFPEEMNRRMISLIASYHFAPTSLAAEHLYAEGIAEDTIFITGNTVVDALQMIQTKIAEGEIVPSPFLIDAIARAQHEQKHIVTFTAHRRESFEYGLETILHTLKEAVALFPALHIIFPVHPNPYVRALVQQAHLDTEPAITLIDPLSYSDMVYLLSQSDLIITDSGGLQEEAVSLRKPVIVLRETSERMEGIAAGLARLVGFERDALLESIEYYLDPDHYVPSRYALYGDGTAGSSIAAIINSVL